MPEEKAWHAYITEADKETDTAKLRAIVRTVARELADTEQTLQTLERSLLSEEARDEKSARALRAAHAARQVVAIKAIRALAKLLPAAIQQATDKKNPRPALLRLILRATK